MNTYSLTITSADPAAINRALHAAAGGAPVATMPAATSEASPSTVSGAAEPPPGDVTAAKKAAAAAKRKAAAAAKRVADAQKAVDEAKAAEAEGTADLGLDVDAPSIDDVKAAVRVCVEATSVDNVKTIFHSLDAEKISDIPVERYAELIERLQA